MMVLTFDQERQIIFRSTLTILVENSEYDPPFLNAIMKFFDDSGELLAAKSKNGGNMEWEEDLQFLELLQVN